MKLKGIGVILPICDLRPFLDANSRLTFLDRVDYENSVIKGFGRPDRRKLDIHWRPSDTEFFECDRAISLPDRLPDGAPVIRAVRRLYLDRGLVRLELLIFGNPKHSKPPSLGSLADFARQFWEGDVRVSYAGTKMVQPLAHALPIILKKFIEKTCPLGHVRSDLVVSCEPQLQVIAECADGERGHGYRGVDEQGRISIRLASLPSFGRRLSVDTAYITHRPGYFRNPGNEAEFQEFQIVRAYLAGLHADLEVLRRLLQYAFSLNEENEALSKYILKVAHRLRSAPSRGRPVGEIVAELLKIAEQHHHNRISRLLEDTRNSSLPMQVRNSLFALLEPWLEDAALNRSIRPNAEVFISYRKLDCEKLAKQIYEKLCNYRPTFLDTGEIPIGANAEREFLKAASTARYFIALISRHYFESEFCKLEIAHAARCRRRFIRVNVGPMPIAPADMPWIDSIQWVPFHGEPTHLNHSLEDSLVHSISLENNNDLADVRVQACVFLMERLSRDELKQLWNRLPWMQRVNPANSRNDDIGLIREQAADESRLNVLCNALAP